MIYPVPNHKISGYGYIWLFHMALDLAPKSGQAAGSPILAPMAGTVIAVGTNPNYVGGLYVIIREDHKDRLEHYTGHHRRILVKVGQKVKEGQKIAEMGATGQAQGFHTHWQIRRPNAGALLNPTKVYEARKPKPKPKKVYTKVRTGEGLSQIARRAGYKDWFAPTSWARIAKLNGRGNWILYNKSLKPGQRIRVR